MRPRMQAPEVVLYYPFILPEVRGRGYHVPSFTHLTPFYYNNEIIAGTGADRVSDTSRPLSPITSLKDRCYDCGGEFNFLI